MGSLDQLEASISSSRPIRSLDFGQILRQKENSQNECSCPGRIKDDSDTRHMELRMTKTALAGARRVGIGPFRELRIKKTAPRGIKDEKDCATWN